MLSLEFLFYLEAEKEAYVLGTGLGQHRALGQLCRDMGPELAAQSSLGLIGSSLKDSRVVAH